MTNRKSGSSWFLAVVFLAAVAMAACLGGCAETPRTVLKFKGPRVFLHLHESPVDVKNMLKSDGPRIQTGLELDAGADFVITGTGVIHWATRSINVKKDGIDIDGVFIKSLAEGSRNVTIARDGSIQEDTFIPFEPPWGYHPSRR